jgi:hypothetical protein
MTTLEELVVKLTADSSKFTSEMDAAGNKTQEFSDKADNTQSSSKSLGMAFTELNSVVSLVKQGIELAKQAYEATAGVFLNYADQVRDMTRATGMSAEETSRLIQVADDVGITYEKLTTSLQMAARQGIDVSTESLKNLSDQYLALEPGVKRTQFLLETFGRSGADMGKMMELGSEGIGKVNASIEDGLILTEEVLKEARAHEILSDMLGDEIQQKKILAGMTVSEVVSTAKMNMLVNMRTKELTAAAHATGELSDAEYFAGIGSSKYIEQAREQIQAEIDLKTELGDTTSAVYDQAEAQEVLAQKMSEVAAGIAGKPTEIMVNYREDLADLREEEADLTAQLELAAIQYGANSTQVADLTEKLADNKKAQEDLYGATERAMSMLIYEALAADLDSDQALILAKSLGLLDQPSYDLALILDGLNKKLDDGTISFEEYTVAAGIAKDKLLEYDGTTANMYVNTYLQTVHLPETTQAGGEAWKITHGYASGGSFTVPGSGTGDRPYTIGLTPGENVAITPKGKTEDNMRTLMELIASQKPATAREIALAVRDAIQAIP